MSSLIVVIGEKTADMLKTLDEYGLIRDIRKCAYIGYSTIETPRKCVKLKPHPRTSLFDVVKYAYRTHHDTLIVEDVDEETLSYLAQYSMRGVRVIALTKLPKTRLFNTLREHKVTAKTKILVIEDGKVVEEHDVQIVRAPCSAA